MNIQNVFNETSTQSVVGISLKGEPATIIKLGYATVYEFPEFKLIEVVGTGVCHCIDSDNRPIMVGQESFFYQCMKERIESSTVLFESKLTVQ
ncbi:hypothetical protein [Cedecea lapagei]|uniref:hypothetical protein n=1 Tax=Cedecea lapagei TaxID=158823 RepID=UPI001BCAFE3D|nr:hypothetical protein [Cedecea lapagei]